MPLIIPFVPRTGTAAVVSTMEEPRAALSGAQGLAPTIAAVEQEPVAALAGAQKQTGTMAVTVTRPTDALAGSQAQAGTMGATVAKPVAAATGAQPFTGTISGTARKAAFAGSGSKGDFVTRDAATGNLMLAGERYRVAGPNFPYVGLSELGNNYGGTLVEGLHLSTHSELDDLLDEAVAMNATAIRAMGAVMTIGKQLAIQPSAGTFNDNAFEPVDYMLQQCELLGIRLIMPLVDNYQFFQGGKFEHCTFNGVTPDSQATQFFTNSTVIAGFKTYINHVLDHVNVYTGIAYKNDPTILCWETGNEIGGATIAQINAWTENIASHIKVTKNAQQLVMDGHTYEFVEPPDYDATHVDIFTNHMYWPGNEPQKWIAEATTIKSHGKAYMLGEYSWNGQTPQVFPIINTGWTLTEVCSAAETDVIDGDFFWELLPSLSSFGNTPNFTLHYPADTSNNKVSQADMAIWAEQLKNHAGLVRDRPVQSAWYVTSGISGGSTGRSRAVTFNGTLPASVLDPEEGDLIVLIAGSVSVNAITVPAGWINCLAVGTNTVVSSDSHTLAAVGHIVTAAEAAATTTTYTCTNLFNTSANGDVVGLVIRGVDPSNPVVTAASTFSSTDNASPHVLAGLTGSSLIDDAIVISGVANAGGGSGRFYTTPVGWGMNGFANGNQCIWGSVRNGRAQAGVNIAATNIVTGVADEYCSITVALRPITPTGNGAITETATISGTGVVGKSATAAFTVTAGIVGLTSGVLYPSTALYPSTSKYPTSGA